MRAVKSAYEDGMGQEIQLMSKAAGRKYILEEQTNLDWIIRSSFIQLQLVSDGSIIPAYYNDNNEQILIDYINTYKPYHTKIREIFNSKIYYENVNLTVEEQPISITIT